MQLNLVLLYQQKYYQYQFNKNDLTDIDTLNTLSKIMHYVKGHDVYSYILKNEDIEQFVGNAVEVKSYKDLL